MTLTVERRQEIEREIAERLVDKVLSLNLLVSVYNGDDGPQIKNCSVKEAILNEMFATDQDELHILNQRYVGLGEIVLIYGNTGYDVVANYSANELTESIIESVQDLVQKYELEAT